MGLGGKAVEVRQETRGAGPGYSLGPDWARSGGGQLLYGVSVLFQGFT
jgi:hypothetical protein